VRDSQLPTQRDRMYRAVLYISDSTLSGDPETNTEVKKINDISSKANKEHNIYGVLAHSNNRFLHILEGQESTISTLLENIQNDSRNKNLSIILDIKKNERIYTDWEMIDSPSQKQSELLGSFLRRSIDELPLIEEHYHKILEDFVNNIFH